MRAKASWSLLFFSIMHFMTVPLVMAGGIPLKDGSYRFIGVVYACHRPEPAQCLVVDQGSQSERSIPMEPSRWSKTLSSLGPRIPVVLNGSMSRGKFSISTAPRLHRESVDQLLDPPKSIQPAAH